MWTDEWIGNNSPYLDNYIFKTTPTKQAETTQKNKNCSQETPNFQKNLFRPIFRKS